MSIFGKLLYKIYYRPRSRRNTYRKYGGKRNYNSIGKAEEEMKAYALSSLKFSQPVNESRKFKINFLTGDKYIHQSLFCVYSFFKNLSEEEKGYFSINFYDDGSLSKTVLDYLTCGFPFINIITAADSVHQLTLKLPVERYPFIHKKLADLPLMKKLVYIHQNNSGLNSFFDSDMLFMKRPAEYLDWLEKNRHSNDHAFSMLDVKRSYGYDERAIKHVWTPGLVNNINSGLYAINSEQIDFELVESLIEKFETGYGSNYYVEQLITAILLERSPNLHVASPGDYIVLPTKIQVEQQAGVLHHYVDTAKSYYFKQAWREII